MRQICVKYIQSQHIATSCQWHLHNAPVCMLVLIRHSQILIMTQYMHIMISQKQNKQNKSEYF